MPCARPAGCPHPPVVDKWSEEIVGLITEEFPQQILRAYVPDQAAVNRESSAAIDRDVMVLTIGYVLIITYTCVVLSRNSWTYMKSHLVGATLACCGFAIVSSFGLASLMGYKASGIGALMMTGISASPACRRCRALCTIPRTDLHRLYFPPTLIP